MCFRPNPSTDSTYDMTAICPLQPGQKVPPSVDTLLSNLIREARNDDRETRNHLYSVYQPMLDPICRKVYRTTGRMAGQDLEDVIQQSFITFCELVETWPGTGSFTAYVLSTFRFRLNRAVRKLGDLPRQSGHAESQYPIQEPTGSFDVESTLLLEEICQQLDPFRREVVLLKVRDEFSNAEIARQLGVNRRTVQRSWRMAREHISRVLFTRR